jgi:hypothetical protein
MYIKIWNSLQVYKNDLIKGDVNNRKDWDALHRVETQPNGEKFFSSAKKETGNRNKVHNI